MLLPVGLERGYVSFGQVRHHVLFGDLLNARRRDLEVLASPPVLDHDAVEDVLAFVAQQRLRGADH